MMHNHGSKLFSVLLGLGVLADAHAATFTLEPAVVPVGGSITFSFTSEIGAWPGGLEGAEQPTQIHFNGPCTNDRNLLQFNQYGYGYDVTFPAPGWSNFLIQCSTLSKPGDYVATFSYRRLDASGLATTYQINLPFTVLAPLDLEVIPRRIPVGDTLSLSADVNPGQPATITILCPNLYFGVTEPFDFDRSLSWPGPDFDDPRCDSSLPGEYIAQLAGEAEGSFDEVHFWVYGDRDGDGLLDLDDNCPNDPNSGQEDLDGDDQGDVCDPDDDGDGVDDENDNCPALANTSQDDLDEDGQGNTCDPDVDGDGIANESDNCPNVANPEQQEACVPDPGDTDGDGQPNLGDNCPDTFNPGQQDPDGDGIGTACDLDVDGDGLGNDEEAAAGTDPRVADTLDEDGITALWAGTVLSQGAVVEDGEIVGVVIDADPDVEDASVVVIDPVGSPFLLRELLGSTPFAFAFAPIFPGEWIIEAVLGDGAVLRASIHVIPEPGPALGGLVAVATLLGVAAVRRG